MLVFQGINIDLSVVLIILIIFLIAEEVIPRIVRYFYNLKYRNHEIKSLTIYGRWDNLKRMESEREYNGYDTGYIAYH